MRVPCCEPRGHWGTPNCRQRPNMRLDHPASPLLSISTMGVLLRKGQGLGYTGHRPQCSGPGLGHSTHMLQVPSAMCGVWSGPQRRQEMAHRREEEPGGDGTSAPPMTVMCGQGRGQEDRGQGHHRCVCRGNARPGLGSELWFHETP